MISFVQWPRTMSCYRVKRSKFLTYSRFVLVIMPKINWDSITYFPKDGSWKTWLKTLPFVIENKLRMKAKKLLFETSVCISNGLSNLPYFPLTTLLYRLFLSWFRSHHHLVSSVIFFLPKSTSPKLPKSLGAVILFQLAQRSFLEDRSRDGSSF